MPKKYRLAGIPLIVAMLACALPGAATQAPLPPEEIAQTIVAGTMQALEEGNTTVPASNSPEPQATSTRTITSTVGPTSTITPTYSVPLLKLTEQTNCRTGPGLSYDILFAYVKGVTREIIGYYPKENYWLVKAPDSITGECWIWGEYAEITGSYWVVPELTPPPTATMSLPKAPAVEWSFFCSSATGVMDISMTWNDYATNESGYSVIRNDQTIAEIAANSTSFTDSFVFTPGEKIVYQIEVYNITGFTRSSPISITC
jgi:SH3-like domain-containing protein